MSQDMHNLSRDVTKPEFCICENKDADQLRGNREADQRLCFRYIDIKSLCFLNPKFQASSRLLWLYSPVCVRPGLKPRRPGFSQRGSFLKLSKHLNIHRVQSLHRKRGRYTGTVVVSRRIAVDSPPFWWKVI